jgi:hypothetical protein
MGLLNLFHTDKHKVSRYSRFTAQSADRAIRWHNAYVKVEPQHEKPIRLLYLRELRILLSRCLKLSFYLLIHRKRVTVNKAQEPSGATH